MTAKEFIQYIENNTKDLKFTKELNYLFFTDLIHHIGFEDNNDSTIIYYNLTKDFNLKLKSLGLKRIKILKSKLIINSNFTDYDILLHELINCLYECSNVYNFNIENELVNYFDKNGWINTKKYNIPFYYESENNWIGFYNSKNYFSIYYAHNREILDYILELNDDCISFSKGTIMVKFNSLNFRQIFSIITNYVKK